MKSGGFETRPQRFAVRFFLLRDLRNTIQKFSPSAQIFRWPVASKTGILLAPRRQERQLRKFNFFAPFAPLREIFRVLVSGRPCEVLRRKENPSAGSGGVFVAGRYVSSLLRCDSSEQVILTPLDEQKNVGLIFGLL